MPGTHRCCCRSCWSRGSCKTNLLGDFDPLDPYDLTLRRGRCCKCFPKRICATLTFPAGCNCDGDDPDDEYDRSMGTQLEFDCESYSYSGSFSCSNTGEAFDFQIFMIEDSDDGYKCWISFESVQLGYTGPDSLRIPLGGEYQEHDLKKSECAAFEFEFDIDLGEAFTGCGVATLSIAPDDLIEVPICREETCVYPRACITLSDDYGEETLLVCLDELEEYTNGYRVLFANPYSDAQIEVTIFVDSEVDPPTLRIEALDLGDLVTEETVEADCPAMAASWEFYDGWTVAIKGDQRSWCTDCKCICRCICVTRHNDSGLTTPGKIFVGTACWDDEYACATGNLGGWEVELADVEGEDAPLTAGFYLECDECTGITYLVYDGEPDPALRRKELICPDIKGSAPGSVDLAWVVHTPGDATHHTVAVSCLGCRPCRARVPDSACCPERLGANALPAVLHAEVISTNADCECMMGATADLVWDGNVVDPLWEGFWQLAQGEPPCGPNAEGSYVAVGCCGGASPPPCRDWCMEMCGGGFSATAEPGCSCDPLELTFVGGQVCNPCEEPATSAFTARVTE